MSGMNGIEPGCGTGYVSGWISRCGSRVTAIVVSIVQLATARELTAEQRADITFVEGNAEATGLPDASFDFAISEYGATRSSTSGSSRSFNDGFRQKGT
ncbi:class I SAM-dependent methyltransferase [uncultured Ruegeria sp.]|uniref:class I SAM-dependent methyltransferase n=1 Tax=uncultured Ruegeria sp. TaxID=259304 RepID=UPI00344E438A